MEEQFKHTTKDAMQDDLFAAAPDSLQSNSQPAMDVMPLDAVIPVENNKADLNSGVKIAPEDSRPVSIFRELPPDNQEPLTRSMESEQTREPVCPPERHNESVSAAAEEQESAPASFGVLQKVHLPDTMEDASLGELLCAARTAAGLSYDQIEEVTKIRKCYLIALEQNDLHGLPSAVYVVAYVRALCTLYHLDQTGHSMAEEKLRNLSPHLEVPEKVLQDVEQEHLSNDVEQQRVKKMMYVAGSVITLLIILVSWGLCMVFVPSSAPAPQDSDSEHLRAPVVALGTEEFDDAVFRRLTAPQIPEIQTLELKKSY